MLLPETQELLCPYCGEAIELVIDASGGSQHYIEDCEVCCRPIEVELAVDSGGEAQLSVHRDDD